MTVFNSVPTKNIFGGVSRSQLLDIVWCIMTPRCINLPFVWSVGQQNKTNLLPLTAGLRLHSF